MSDIPVGAQVPPSRAELTEVPNKPLVTSKVTDSAFEKVLPFSTDLELRDRILISLEDCAWGNCWKIWI